MNVDVADDHEQLNRAMNSPSPVFMVGPNKSGHDVWGWRRGARP
jgi:hypothetical protein